MTVVADSCPLIFLAKVRQLALIPRVVGPKIVVPDLVRDEVLAPPVDPAEAEALEAFLRTCRIELVPRPRRFATAMSRTDDCALTLAIRKKAAVLLCDDPIVRRTATAHGIQPLGTLGVLLRAFHRGYTAKEEVRALVDSLVRAHGFRIGVELYQAVLREIGN